MIRPAVPLALVVAAGWVIGSSCGGDGLAAPSETATVLVKVSGDAQSGTPGAALATDPTVEVQDAAGVPLAGVVVRFTPGGGGATSDTAVATGSNGRASVTWLLGPDASAASTLAASVGSLSTAFTATSAAPVAGQVYFGRNEYIEYIAGDLPLIITAPHGGVETPEELPDRTGANITTVRDGNTAELARTIGNVFLARTGGRPHIVIVRLRRTKIDANREISEAAQGHRLAERAWIEYHSFIEAAKHAVVAQHGTGFYVDLHGHGHDIQRLELGYLLDRATLALPDAALDSPVHEDESSIRTLSRDSPASFSALVRGPQSLGALFESEGFPAVPSPASPSLGADEYFDGGYNTARHGSRAGGPISGVQIESNFTGVRDTQANRERFAVSLVAVWESFFPGAGALPASPGVRPAHRPQ
jgi:hypothetical protein